MELMKKHDESGYNLNFIIKSLKKLNFAPSDDSFPKYLDGESKEYLIKVMNILALEKNYYKVFRYRA